KASTLLEQIGTERSWSTRDIEKDVDILERNRLYTIKDLRVLSPQSWKEIDLLPLVKDLLRHAVNPPEDYNKLKQDKKKMKKEKKDRKKEEKKLKLEKLSLKDKDEQKGQEVKDASKSEGTAVNEEGQVKIHRSKKEKRGNNGPDDTANEESASSSPSSESSESSDSDSSISSTEVGAIATNPLSSIKTPGKPSLAPGPGRIQPMGNRIRVTAGNGTTYEVDRYCPHKHVDLATKGVVVGNTLFCNKHNWGFALDNKGFCSKHGATVNACKVDW
ncbi:hypothetical protein BGZ58_005960, partial [Dissophora ornata]